MRLIARLNDRDGDDVLPNGMTVDEARAHACELFDTFTETKKFDTVGERPFLMMLAREVVDFTIDDVDREELYEPDMVRAVIVLYCLAKEKPGRKPVWLTRMRFYIADYCYDKSKKFFADRGYDVYVPEAFNTLVRLQREEQSSQAH